MLTFNSTSDDSRLPKVHPSKASRLKVRTAARAFPQKGPEGPGTDPSISDTPTGLLLITTQTSDTTNGSSDVRKRVILQERIFCSKKNQGVEKNEIKKM